MLSFVNDYCEGAHPLIMKKLLEINLEKQPGYGADGICASARERIKKACSCPEAEIAFLTGGTQTNIIAIDALCRPYEAVIAADSGHINVHESGAIEHAGHKVIALPSRCGKLSANDLSEYLENFFSDDGYEHMAIPGMVYISQPTELGTLYSREELKTLHKLCAKHKLPLYIDGARLSSALAADSRLKLSDIAKYSEAFYIGGTKCGALFGEALVFTKNNMPEHFMTRIKQLGALLAKGWLVGAQYDILFSGGLYKRLGENAVLQADRIREALRAKGIELYSDSPTNQVFAVLGGKAVKKLSKNVEFGIWEKLSNREDSYVIRLCASWATTDDDCGRLVEKIRGL